MKQKNWTAQIPDMNRIENMQDDLPSPSYLGEFERFSKDECAGIRPDLVKTTTNDYKQKWYKLTIGMQGFFISVWRIK